MTTSFELLGRTIKQAQWKHHRALDSRMRVHGITLMQWDALREIAREPGATARRLAAETFQSEQSFGVMAARMESAGLIERSSGGGRRIEHRLTAEGERMLELGRGIASGVFARSLGVLDDADRDLLYGLLERVIAAEL